MRERTNSPDDDSKAYYYGLTLALALGGAILLPTLWYDLGGDQGHYCYVAWAWLEQNVPPCKSSNTCDMPGIIFITWLAFKTLGSSILALRIFDLLFQLLGLGLIFHLSYSLSEGEKPYLAGVVSALLYALFYLGLGHWHTAQRDGFGLPLLLLSAFGYLQLGKRRNFSAIALTGIFVGMAFLIKPPLGIAGLVFSAVLLRRAWRMKISPGKALLEQSLLACSALLPLLAAALIYRATGSGLSFWRDCLNFTLNVYVHPKGGASAWTGLGFLIRNESVLLYSLFTRDQVIWLGFFLYLLFAFSSEPASETKAETRMVLLGLLLAGMISYLAQGRDFAYHKTPLLGIAAVFAGEFFCTATGRLFAGQGWRPRIVRALAVMVLLGLQFLSVGRREMHLIASVSLRSLDTAYMLQEPLFHKTAQYISKNSRPGQVVGGSGFSPVLFLAKRLAPTRQTFFTVTTFRDGNGQFDPLVQKWRFELCDDIAKAGPQYMLWQELLNDNECLKDYLENNYTLDTTIKDLNGLTNTESTFYVYRKK